MICTLEEAFADPKATYETGILDMEFVERVNVFENYVDADQIADVDEQVAEVTKEKESNKIYVVESGDCLSVIAMDHDTTVSSIVALNGLDSADAMIRDGQELIIAVPEPDLQLRVTKGEVYEEDYTEDPIIIDNDSWYTTKEVVQQEGTTPALRWIRQNIPGRRLSMESRRTNLRSRCFRWSMNCCSARRCVRCRAGFRNVFRL